MATRRSSRGRTRKHQVNITLQAFDISKAGTSLDLIIFSEGEKLGQVTLGRGSITWRGRSRRKTKTLSWSRFAEKLDEWAYGI